MLEEEYPLPGSQEHPAAGDRDGLRRSCQGHAKVTGHVIGPLTGMLKPRRVFGDEAVEKFVQIPTGGRVGVFHDHKAAAGVADEHRQNTLRDAADLQKMAHLSGNLDSSLAAGFNLNGLVPDKE